MPNMAEQIARAASAFEQQRTGRAPRSVTVVLSGETLVITLYGVLSPAERALANNPDGAAQVQELHRQLFATSSEPLCEEIARITGVEVRHADSRESTAAAVVPIFTAGAIVQVLLLASALPTDAWSGPTQ